MQINLKHLIITPVYNAEKYLHECLDSLGIFLLALLHPIISMAALSQLSNNHNPARVVQIMSRCLYSLSKFTVSDYF